MWSKECDRAGGDGRPSYRRYLSARCGGIWHVALHAQECVKEIMGEWRRALNA